MQNKSHAISCRALSLIPQPDRPDRAHIPIPDCLCVCLPAPQTLTVKLMDY